MNERALQKFVQRALQEPAKIWTTTSGKRLQILSPGRINPFAGPDYLDMGMMLNGFIVIGDAEFHRNASDWTNHNHSGDERYKSVVLHIVFNNNIPQNEQFETLILDEKEVLKYSEPDKKDAEEILRSAEDLQHFALVRILRKASEAQTIRHHFSIEETLGKLASEFIDNFEKKRRRPVYDSRQLHDILISLRSSKVMDFLYSINAGDNLNIPGRMLELLKSKIGDEGAAFRRELILNSILPLALCLADEQGRINLFLWFWSTPALNHYGILARRFPDFSQNFLWQQQGMLEYMREHGQKNNIEAGTMSNYGFLEILDFYRIGKSPYIESEEGG